MPTLTARSAAPPARPGHRDPARSRRSQRSQRMGKPRATQRPDRRAGQALPHSVRSLCCFMDRVTRSTGQDPQSWERVNKASELQLCRAAYRNRTDDLRITRGTIPSRARASCTDSTEHRADSTRRAEIIRLPGPRTGPRPRPYVPIILLLCVTSLRAIHPRPRAGLAVMRSRTCNRPTHIPCALHALLAGKLSRKRRWTQTFPWTRRHPPAPTSIYRAAGG